MQTNGLVWEKKDPMSIGYISSKHKFAKLQLIPLGHGLLKCLFLVLASLKIIDLVFGFKF